MYVSVINVQGCCFEIAFIISALDYYVFMNFAYVKIPCI